MKTTALRTRRAWVAMAAALMLGAAAFVAPPTAYADHSNFQLGFRFSSGPAVYHPWVMDFAGYYGCPSDVVEQYRVAGLPEDDLAVAVYLSHASGLGLDLILGWRRDGESWFEITNRCGVSPAVFFTPIASTVVVSGPYAGPYRHWREAERDGRFGRWHMSDREAHELVGLRFATSRYHHDAGWVMRERSRGHGWDEFTHERHVDRGGGRGHEGRGQESGGRVHQPGELKWKSAR